MSGSISSEQKSEVFQLESGAKVYWKYTDIFYGHELEIDNSDPQNIMADKWCGNPYNLMTDQENKDIKSKRPAEPQVPCNLASMAHNDIIEEKDLPDDLIDNINGDCWGAFTMTNDRKDVVNIYYDSRNSKNLLTKESRTNLTNDPGCLIDDIKQGHTVVLVFGGNEFLEIYYSKIGEYIISTKVYHKMKKC